MEIYMKDRSWTTDKVTGVCEDCLKMYIRRVPERLKSDFTISQYDGVKHIYHIALTGIKEPEPITICQSS